MFPISVLKCWIIPIAVIAIAAILGGGSLMVAGMLFLGSAVLLGLPHGGCDPWMPYWIGHGVSGACWILLAYIALSAAMAGLWWLRADAALTVFLGVTAWHWGTTDAQALEIPHHHVWGLGRGFLIIGAATGWQPELTTAFFKTVVVPTPLTEFLTSWGAWLAALGLVMELAVLYWSRCRTWPWILAESVGLIFLFLAVHPLLAITTYLVGIHALRSIDRLRVWLPAWFQRHPWTGFHLAALPGSLAVLAVLPLCAMALPETSLGTERWVAAYFVLLSILTLPHAILFAALPAAPLLAHES
jgi:beta-carotene 15,15'-dioxygenase